MGSKQQTQKNVFTKKDRFVGLRCGGIRKVASCDREHSFSVRMWVNRLSA